MQHLLHFILVLCFGLLNAQIANATEIISPTLTERTEKFDAEMASISKKSVKDSDLNDYWYERQAAFRRNFPKAIHQEFVNNADKAQLKRLYSEVYSYLLVVNDPSALSFLESIFKKQKANKWLEEKGVWAMHRLYLMLRQFHKAADFRQEHPGQDLVAPPEIKNWGNYGKPLAGGNRPVINTVADESFLELGKVDFSAFSGVVVVGHPRCPFFKAFMKAAGADPALFGAFHDNTIWLTDASLTDGAVIKWNESMPKVRFHYIASEVDWPEINYWGSPSFYFFRDSKLVRKVVGWPRDEVETRKAALIDGFQAIGINIATSSQTAD